MISKRLEVIINSAVVRANKLKHEYLTLECLFLSLLEDDEVKRVLIECGADIAKLSEELNAYLRSPDHFTFLNAEQIEILSKQQFSDEEVRKLAYENGVYYQPEISLALQRVIQRALIHVQSSGKKDIYGINILVAVFNEQESYVNFLFDKYGISKFDVIKLIAHGVDKPLTTESSLDNIRSEFGPSDKAESKDSALDLYCVNLNELVRLEKIDPIIGRDEEVERLALVLARRRKNNPLLVGDAGVGKTAIIEGLAYRIEHKLVPEILEKIEIYSLDMASLLAGSKYRGDFEQRLKNVIKDIQKINESGTKSAVLFIDEIHTIMGAGSTNGGSMDASNLLKPALSNGSIRCIGSTTHEEYRKHIEKDSAFGRRFQRIDIDEPSVSDTLKILLGLRDKFEVYHGVKYSNQIVKAIVDLASKHITDRKNPDKSIDVMDEVGAMIKVLPSNKRHLNITKKDIEEIVSKIAKIPKMTVASDEVSKLKNLKENLKLSIFGQDEACDNVADAIILARSGLSNDEKPIGSFLFTGPTGVGKTELARKLAELLGMHIERFDMSEYMEKHSVSKLIGAPPGYVGHEDGGMLTDIIKKHPHSLLLLDEIEKAHPDIFNILLQIMDHGKLTDAKSRTTDFKNVVIIMTSNAGARELESGTIGLASIKESATGKRDQAIKNFFTPEFRNRLDKIIHFNKLSDSEILKIVDKFLTILESKLHQKGILLIVSDRARQYLKEIGFDPKMGARPLGRIIDQEIKKPLSNEILFGKLTKGGKVLVNFSEERQKISFEFQN